MAARMDSLTPVLNPRGSRSFLPAPGSGPCNWTGIRPGHECIDGKCIQFDCAGIARYDSGSITVHDFLDKHVPNGQHALLHDAGDSNGSDL